ncbi:TetR/AcrR family transcriptional regulator [Streptomyces solicathayae]|uniref:TetR/AcrR family transcriptional regulator n=1 Tax=Streptomyces solicathayae TaxID=3081768 RepID=A0ABZ0LQH3_9ACTN|nr:TetR/AcrR family transcriptional regulator [Streptomyces sp. HUAS YS2]WOX21607.1 TetR/AcrR family transcriptional regulator [Streptomyces sp. HUAS YS2]
MARVPTAERRNDLVNAAIQVIATHGVDGATTRRIAEKAKAPLATLHYCFQTKELLFAAVFEKLAERYREVLIESDVHGDVAVSARAMLRGLMNWYLESPTDASVTIELISWAQRQEAHPAVTVYSEAVNVARSILARAASGQDIAPEMIDRIAYVIGALSDGFAVNWLTYADRSRAAEQAEIVVDVLDAWLAAKLA